ncbi:MAG: dihydrolipoamide acetyltransferase family protein [Desulfurococcales archaeon]|jgi:pyruvate dehydrogenase E2 component (dihydrolipoamide acetyltransferase)|nr:dihydrolipoamide acetyltransferase family protein [Desulfurococcales archaeon]
MARTEKIKLPDIGEGIAEGEIIRWLVKEGDPVKKFQSIVEILTDKASVEIPSPYSGRVIKLLAREGERVRVGTPIAEIEVEDLGRAAIQEAVEKPGERHEIKAVPAVPQAESVAEERKPRVRAPPRVRKLAQELGVDLTLVRGTGPGGVVTEEDVKRFYEENIAKTRAPQAVVEPQQVVVEDRVERIQLRGIKRRMAERMIEAKSKIPHVYLAEEVDVTELVRLRESFKQLAESKGVKLTYLPFIIKAVVKALKEYPLLNSSLDMNKGEIVVKKYYNIGVAVDTEQGLVVPNIKNADGKGLFQIAREIEDLARKAREGKLSLEDIRDGTFTITNIGSIGSTIGFPIINYPESAILGIHRIVKKPSYHEDRLEPRYYMNISLSFDHRFIEGGYAARFLATLKNYLENPLLFLVQEEEFK